MVSNIPFKCPDCHHDLTVYGGTEISDLDDNTSTTCSRCGRTIRKDEIIQQAREHAEILVRDILRIRLGK
ncbi:ECs_2282 family putative zinc-binding protein [Enterobacter ludwigii]|uniref:ECs_2282 family putative zinc-binding protein n=1 Tax=Enterobacter TaxID=547 RepID=UPI003A0FE900